MRYRKILAIVIVVVMLTIALVGCDALRIGNNNENDDSTTVDDSQNNNDDKNVDDDDNEDDGICLSAIYAWINEFDVEDIVKVRYERGSMGVTPGDLTNVSYSSNSVDIQKSYALLLSKLTPLGDEFRFPVGGGYVQYDFYTTNGKTFSLSMNIDLGDGLVYFDNQFYLVTSFHYTFQHAYLNCHSFTQPADSYLICSTGDDFQEYGEINLGNLEFCVYSGTIDAEPTCRLMGNFVNLLVLSNNLFTIEGSNTVYQVTSEKDFSQLFTNDNK